MPTLDEVVRSFHHHFFAISIAGVTQSCGVAGPSSKRREWWQFQTQRSFSAVVSSTNCSALTCLHEIPVWVIFSSRHQGRKCWYPPRFCSVLYPKMRRDDRGFVCSKTSRCYNLPCPHQKPKWFKTAIEQQNHFLATAPDLCIPLTKMALSFLAAIELKRLWCALMEE